MGLGVLCCRLGQAPDLWTHGGTVDPGAKTLGSTVGSATVQWHVSHTSCIPGGSAGLETSPQVVPSGSHSMSGEAQSRSKSTTICLGEGQSRSHHFGTSLLPCSSLNPTVREAGRGQIKTGIKAGRLNTLP